MIEPYKGRVYDPCAGSGGMFVQSQRFVEELEGRKDDIKELLVVLYLQLFKICSRR
jgi:type I restriction enzyme M protein